MTETAGPIQPGVTAAPGLAAGSAPAEPAGGTGEVERLAYTVPEAADALGVSRSHGYELVRRGLLPAVELGGRTLIPRMALLCHLQRLLRRQQARHGRDDPGGAPSAARPDGARPATDADADGVEVWSWTCDCGALTLTWSTRKHHR